MHTSPIILQTFALFCILPVWSHYLSNLFVVVDNMGDFLTFCLSLFLSFLCCALTMTLKNMNNSFIC